MPKIRHSKKSKSQVKTIKIKGEGLIKVLDDMRQKIEDLNRNHSSIKIAEDRAEEFGEKNIFYGEEVERLGLRVEYLRDQLRLCDPKHDEFDEEKIEEKNFYHSRLNGKRKRRVVH